MLTNDPYISQERLPLLEVAETSFLDCNLPELILATSLLFLK